MDDVIIARALHVLAVVIWIGGVMMVTTVVLPAVRHGDLGTDRLIGFHAIEHRLVWQARTAVIAVGLTGFYMSARARRSVKCCRSVPPGASASFRGIRRHGDA